MNPRSIRPIPSRIRPIPATLLAAALAAALPLAAQEVVDVTGRDQRLDADFEEVFRVGVLRGQSWEMFGTVREVGFDAQGNLYVFDGLGSGVFGGEGLRVLVFDPSGAFVREFGSSGEGPGEFNNPSGYAVMRDGTTIVSDMGHRAYQVFDEAGNYVRMVRTSDAPGGISIATGIMADPRGGAVIAANAGISISSVGSNAPSTPPTSRPVLRVGLGGEVIETDTVADGWLPPRGEPGEGLPSNIRVGGRTLDLGSMFGGLVMPSIFEPTLLAGVLPDGGLVYSDSSAYALKVTPPDSRDVTRIINRPFQPEPVTDATKEEYEERQERRREEGGVPTTGGSVMIRTTGSSGGATQSAQPATMSFEMPERTYYPELPVLRALFTTWEGRIWVRRRGDEPQSDGPIDVLTAEGDYVGTFPEDATEMPDAFGPDGMAAFIELDDFDVARVVVRRLPAAIR